MIYQASNITLSQIAGVAKSAASVEVNQFRSGDFVNVEVLEKIDGKYKILVNGKLFQTQFPTIMKKGEEFIAMISSKNPLTLILNEIDLNTGRMSSLLSALRLDETKFNLSLLEKLTESKKVLSKKKIKRILEIAEHYKFEIDELQLSLLINLIWNEEDKKNNFSEDEFKKIFDVSFRELISRIFEQVKALIDLRIPKQILQKINHNMIYDLDKPEELNSLKDKTKSFVELISFVNAVVSSADLPFIEINELKKFRKLLLKYILQKSFYSAAGLFPDFTIVNYHNPSRLVYFVMMRNSDFDVTRLISEFELKNMGRVNIDSFFINNDFKGKISSEKMEDILQSEIKLFNNIVKNDLQVESNLFVDSCKATLESKKNSYKKLNVTV